MLLILTFLLFFIQGSIYAEKESQTSKLTIFFQFEQYKNIFVVFYIGLKRIIKLNHYFLITKLKILALIMENTITALTWLLTSTKDFTLLQVLSYSIQSHNTCLSNALCKEN